MSTEERTADRVMREESEEADRALEVDLHEDRTQEFATHRENRLRYDWSDEFRDEIHGIHSVVERLLLETFSGAYQIMNEMYEIVREPKLSETSGEIETDVYGFTIWAVNEYGNYIEDYTLLGSKEVKDFLFKITTRLFQWEQDAARIHGDAMYAKALWERSFALGYTESRLNGGRTVEDRTQAGRVASLDDRFFGIFQSNLSRRADALVRSMTLISQRLKDVLSV